MVEIWAERACFVVHGYSLHITMQTRIGKTHISAGGDLHTVEAIKCHRWKFLVAWFDLFQIEGLRDFRKIGERRAVLEQKRFRRRSADLSSALSVQPG